MQEHASQRQQENRETQQPESGAARQTQSQPPARPLDMPGPEAGADMPPEGQPGFRRALLDFLDGSPNSFFAVRNIARQLEAAGFQRLQEAEAWDLRPGAACFVTRNQSSLIAFRVPPRAGTGFQLLACHGDSPCFRVKPGAALTVENRYVLLNLEKYGGMLCATWFDRPLSVAGRILLRTPGGLESRLVCVDRDLLIIPSLAIHMDRTANDGIKYNVQTDMLPLLSADVRDTLPDIVAAEAGVRPEDILDMDLYLYNRMKATLLGANGEFLVSGRLDDLQCVFAGLWGFLQAAPGANCPVLCVFDNEEVGSATRQGAASTFLRDTLQRVNAALGGSGEDYLRALANSFMVSADNAQGVHPNHRDKADPVNRPVLNGGIVLKYSANQKYTTDAVSGALFRLLCERADVPVQTFVNRADMAGGSTLGNISATRVPVRAVDVGLAQLAMHSACETAGAEDAAYLARAARELFSAALRVHGDGAIELLPAAGEKL